jgi:protein subunit release factor A
MLSVSVLPIIADNRLTFSESDVTIETYNAGGKGGQHQNKTDSAVRVKHKQTGIIVSVNGRCQHKNKVNALKVLRAKVNGIEQERADKKRQDLKREQVENIGRGNKVRTYNFIDSRVVDHNTGKKTSQIRKVMKGRFDLIL